MVRFLIYGWVERFFVGPSLHFKYWGFSWVQPMAGPAMTALFWALSGLALCMAVGLFFRVAAVLLSLGLIYIQLIDVTTYLNHYYLAALLACLLSVSPAGRIWSLDNRLSARRGRTGPSGAVPALWLYLLRFQVGVVYSFAGLAKLNEDWLVHAQPLRIWLGTRTDLPILGPLFTLEGVPLAISWAGFLFDATIVLWLSWRRTRVPAYLAVLVFHTLTRVLFPIGMFPVIMSLSALVFFEPDWPRRVLAPGHAALRWLLVRLGSHRRVASKRVPPGSLSLPESLRAPSTLGAPQRLGLGVAIAYCTLQLALPLRFLAYGGNVMWHEQGMRFSWRVMLRAKGGSATFVVHDRVTGRRVRVAPRRYLTDLQEAEMVSQPDLILQLAHHIERDFEQRGWQDVEVRVESRISLNGRRSTPLVDPRVDLTARREGLRRPDWVTAAPREVPHHTRPVL